MSVLASIIDRSISGSFSSNASSVGAYTFYFCSKLSSVSLPNATYIGDSVFVGCSNLTTISVGTRRSGVCQLGSNAFNGCTNLTNIYVPASLVNSYKSATNWSNYADKIKATP